MSKKLTHIVAEATLNASLDEVWNLVALQYGHVARYNPAIASSEFTSRQTAGVGTERLCHVAPKGYLREAITKWEDQDFFELEVVDTSFPMHKIISRFTFAEVGAKTHLRQDFWYRMKGPVGWASGMMKGRFLKTLNEGLEGLAYYLEHEHKIAT